MWSEAVVREYTNAIAVVAVIAAVRHTTTSINGNCPGSAFAARTARPKNNTLSDCLRGLVSPFLRAQTGPIGNPPSVSADGVLI